MKKIIYLLLIFIVIGLGFFVFIKGNTTEISLEEQIKNIENIVSKADSSNVDTFVEEVNSDILGEEANDIMEGLEVSSIPVTIEISSNKVYIIPFTDFLNNKTFYYYDDSKVALYKEELSGIGGEITYYFKDDKIIKISQVFDEDESLLKYKTEDEILKIANNVYNRYLRDNN